MSCLPASNDGPISNHLGLPLLLSETRWEICIMHVSPSLGCRADGRRRFAASSPSSTTHHTICCSLFAALDACWIASPRRSQACWSPCVQTPPQGRPLIRSLPSPLLLPLHPFFLGRYILGRLFLIGCLGYGVGLGRRSIGILTGRISRFWFCGASRTEVYVWAGMQRDTRAFFKGKGDTVVWRF